MKKRLILYITLGCSFFAIHTKPKHTKHLADGVQYVKSREYNQAISAFEKALFYNPDLCEAHYGLGLIYNQMSDPDKALNHFIQAIKSNPSFYHSYEHAAILLFKKGDLAKAKEYFLIAVKNNAGSHKALHHLGKIFYEETAMDTSIEYLNQALAREPHDIHIMFDLANAKNVQNKTEEALEIYKKLDQMHPNNPTFLYNIAYTYKKLGQLQTALPYYHKVLQINPEHSDAHFSYGLALLLLGDWTQGWKEYHWRWIQNGKSTFPNFNRPMWDGSDLHGKTIYFRAEQGLGDTFQFIRYVKIAKDMGAYTIVAVQDALLSYMNDCPYIDKLISMKQMPPNFDVYAPLLSCPMIMNTQPDTTPTPIPYLHADKELTAHWKKQLADDPHFKIGICWQGNPNYSTHFLRMTVAAKSVSLETLAPLFDIPGTSFYSLQRKTGTDQIAQLSPRARLTVFDENFDTTHGAFKDTAAVIKNLDLMITVDTSMSHFAAALGIPTWVLIPEPPDWRWMLHRTDTPWYPNMRLFRQPKPGDWKSVVDTIAGELMTLLDVRA